MKRRPRKKIAVFLVGGGGGLSQNQSAEVLEPFRAHGISIVLAPLRQNEA